jgi:hypothetical protein
MVPISSPATSASNHLTPRNNPEDARIQLNRGVMPTIFKHYISFRTLSGKSEKRIFLMKFLQPKFPA